MNISNHTGPEKVSNGECRVSSDEALNALRDLHVTANHCNYCGHSEANVAAGITLSRWEQSEISNLKLRHCFGASSFGAPNFWIRLLSVSET